MCQKLYNETYIQDIADAIREQNGEITQYKVSEMANAIRAISGGGVDDFFTNAKHLVSPNWGKNMSLPQNEEIPRLFTAWSTFHFLISLAVADQLTFTNVPADHDKIIICGWFSNNQAVLNVLTYKEALDPQSLYPNSNIPLRIDGSMYWSGLIGINDIGGYRSTNSFTMQPFTGGFTCRASYPIDECIMFTNVDLIASDATIVQLKNCNMSDFLIVRQS